MDKSAVVVSALFASVVSFGVTSYARVSQLPPQDPAIAAAVAEVATLRDRLAMLEAGLAGIKGRIAHGDAAQIERVEAPGVSDAQIAQAVEAYMLARGAVGVRASGSEPKSDIKELFAGLDGTDYAQNAAAWRKAFEEGRMDDLINMFEEAAEASPNDVGVLMALANAYMAYLQLDQSKWELSMKADKQFDRVLAIDERHWEARFAKAVSYTFWPEFLGKKKSAIAHFETLMEQQDSSPVQDHDYQTYLYLGNLLEDKDPGRAREIWKRGLSRHPNNAELLAKVK